MVKLREDYIVRILPEDLDTLTGDDRLYIKTGNGDYSFYEKPSSTWTGYIHLTMTTLKCLRSRIRMTTHCNW